MSERKHLPTPSSDDFSRYGNELLALLYQKKSGVPNNAYNPSNESYLQRLEESFPGDDWLGDTQDEVSHRANNFFETINQQWLAQPSMGEQLVGKFGATIPHDWLQAIAQQVQQFISSELSGVEELVNCVQPLLAQWSNEDLQVFARPIAVAMRGQSADLLEDLPPWEQLSPVQQARYTLAIADYALQELKQQAKKD